jgi:uncharacterized HAD superfamily protein
LKGLTEKPKHVDMNERKQGTEFTFSTKDIITGNLGQFLGYLKIELDAYRSFIQKAENLIQEEMRKLDELRSGLEKEGEDAGFVHHHTQLEDMENTAMFYIHRNSQLISLFAYFESHLKVLCDLQARDLNLDLKIKDLNGRNYLGQANKYFKKVLKLEMSSLDDIWKKIQAVRLIRNCIAHEDGNFIKDERVWTEQEVYKQVKEHKLSSKVSLSSDGQILIFDIQFLLDFCDWIEEFFTKVCGLIDDVHYQSE